MSHTHARKPGRWCCVCSRTSYVCAHDRSTQEKARTNSSDLRKSTVFYCTPPGNRTPPLLLAVFELCARLSRSRRWPFFVVSPPPPCFSPSPHRPCPTWTRADGGRKKDCANVSGLFGGSMIPFVWLCYVVVVVVFRVCCIGMVNG